MPKLQPKKLAKGYHNFFEWQQAMREYTKASPKIEKGTTVMLWLDRIRPHKKHKKGGPMRHGVAIHRGGKVIKAFGLYTPSDKRDVLYETPKGLISKLLLLPIDNGLREMGYV